MGRGGVGGDEGVQRGRDAGVGAALQLQRSVAPELRLRAQELRLAADGSRRGGRGSEAGKGHPLRRQVRGVLAERLSGGACGAFRAEAYSRASARLADSGAWHEKK